MKNLINEIINKLENEYKFLKFKKSNILVDLIEQELEEQNKEEILKDFDKYFKAALDPDFDFSNISYFDKNEIEQVARDYNNLRTSQNLETAEFKNTSIIFDFVKNNDYAFLVSECTSEYISIYEIDDFYSQIINH